MESPPSITSRQILLLGFVAFALASLWPPILLIVAAVFAGCIPSLFYEGDNAVVGGKRTFLLAIAIMIVRAL